MPTISIPFEGMMQIYVNRDQQIIAERVLRKTPSLLKKGYANGSKKFANNVLRIIKRAMVTGLPPKGVSWPPLSAYTISRYRSWGATHPWYLSGQLYRNVQVVTEGKTTRVGFKRNYTHQRVLGHGERMRGSALVRILETGIEEYRGQNLIIIPPRPLFKPAYEEAGGKQKLKSDIAAAIRTELNKYWRR